MKKFRRIVILLLLTVLITLTFAGCSQGEKGEAGRDGQDGASWAVGVTAPDNSSGKEGDLYMDTVTGDIYIKIDGAWRKTGNLKGENGQEGQPGENGQPGDNGDNGLSAYEIYLKYNPDYEGDEEQWIKDLANGKLARYVVTFDSMGGSTVEPVTVHLRATIGEPEIPEKTGHIFMGWYRDGGYAELWAVDTDRVDEDMTLYAKWEEAEYTYGLAYTLIEDGGAYEVSKGDADVTGTVIIPEKYAYGLPVVKIAEYGFYGDGYYGERYDCSGMTKVIIPDSITSIGRVAFWECNDLKEVVMSANVERIEVGTFAKCSSLTTIKLPDGLKYIGDAAFYACDILKTITIPASVEEIGLHAFSYCWELAVFMKGMIPPKENLSFWWEGGSGSVINDTYVKAIFVPDEALSDYKNAWRKVGTIFQESDYESLYETGFFD